MLRRLWRRLLVALRRDDDPDRAGHRFVPSPLDRSVRVAHGGRDDELDREFARIHREAEQLEDADAESR